MMHQHNSVKLKVFRRELRYRQTDAERLFWFNLRNRQINGIKFYRQYSLGNYILDFYSDEKKLAVELDGGQHNESKNQWHDAKRTLYINSRCIKVLRFWDNEVLTNIKGVLEVLLRYL